MKDQDKTKEQLKKELQQLRQSEQTYSTLVERGNDGIIIIQDGLLAFANSKMIEMTGFSLDEAIGKPFIGFVALAYQGAVKDNYRRRMSGETAPDRYEIEILTKDAKKIPVEISASIIEYEGRPADMAIIRDITERKQAEKQLLHLNDMLSALRGVNRLITHERDRQRLIQRSCELLVETRGYGVALILLVDENRNFISAAGAGGFPSEEAWSVFLERLKHGDYPRCFTEALKRDEPFTILDFGADECKDCDFAYGRVSDTAFINRLEYEGKVYGAILVRVPSEFAQDKAEQDLFRELVSDISFALDMIKKEEERRQTEERLRESEEKFSKTFHSNPNPIIIIRAEDGVYIDANESYSQLMGYERDELIGHSVFELGIWVNLKERERYQELLQKHGVVYDFESEFRTKSGEITTQSFSAEMVSLKGEPCIIVSAKDITERKRAEEELRQSEARYREMADSLPETVIECDDKGNLTFANQNTFKIFGYTPDDFDKGLNIFQMVIPQNRDRARGNIERQLNREKLGGVEYTALRKDGTTFSAIVYASPILRGDKSIGLRLIITDISERKKMEEQLIATDRLASIGELASGIAHELNNPLTSVIGFSDLLLDKEDLPDDIKEDLEVINREAQRTAGVVRNLLTFARGHPEEKQPVDINKVIQNVLSLRAYEQRVNNIEVDTQLAAGLPEVLADSFQLQQVFLNIIINAEHFMKEAHGRGTLTVTTERVGDIIKASFADDGPGISKENLRRLFDPFFTTKEVGKGTGLGLSICHGIITEHDGRIYAESELGKGATFIVELPISKQ